MNKSLLLLTPALALGGCSLLETQPAEDPVLVRLDDLDRRMQAIERIVQNQSLVNLTQQVSAMERRDSELQGQVESLEYESETTADRQRQLYADLDARIQELEASLQASNSRSVLDGGTLAPGQLPVPDGSDRDNYQAAFELLKEQRYEPAAMAFQQFLVAYPDSELADNAQYWLAESHYVTQMLALPLNASRRNIPRRRLPGWPASALSAWTKRASSARLSICRGIPSGACHWGFFRYDAAGIPACLGRLPSAGV
jgi:TolA-binding protein